MKRLALFFLLAGCAQIPPSYWAFPPGKNAGNFQIDKVACMFSEDFVVCMSSEGYRQISYQEYVAINQGKTQAQTPRQVRAEARRMYGGRTVEEDNAFKQQTLLEDERRNQERESFSYAPVYSPDYNPDQTIPVDNSPTPPAPPKVVATAIPKKTEPKPEPPSAQSSSGSGFFVSKTGHVITNEHVVKDCNRITVGDNANKQTPADVIETDGRNDLALLKLSSLDMASAETKSLIKKLDVKIMPLAARGLLRSEDVELGEKVIVVGYPYGDFFSPFTDVFTPIGMGIGALPVVSAILNTIKVTRGIVSANRGMGGDSGQFQMDAAVQDGGSGGPIYDENGNIVGVVTAQLNKLKVAQATGSMPENVNFGIKASTVRQFLTSSGLPSKWSERSEGMSTKQLAKIAEKQTLMVMCHR